MSGRVSFRKGGFNFTFDRAGDAMPAGDIKMGRHADVKINPMVAPAVPMPELVIAADVRFSPIGRQVGVEDLPEQHIVGVVLLIHEPGRRPPQQRDTRSPD